MASNRHAEDDIGRHTKVFSWLQQVFGEDSIPQFEINNFTLGILEKLANINQEQNKHGEIITKDYIQKCSEYAAEAERLSRITEHIGLPVSCMSQSGRTSLKTLASVALLLATKNCSTSRSLDGLKDLAASQAPKLKKNETETDFVRLKCKEYEKTNRELEIYQGKLQLDSSIFHDTLVKKSQDVRTIHEKIKPVKEKLEVYHSLPPDISQARVMVGEAKMQLEMLERQLSVSIDTLHL
ncbi:HAUS augmin-like complex subunit 1 [Acropora cervicornis]|uniref:HAUS augmin-like complex subunit 1 n=1 Tax=Acropora cervicornis TaxID=6130 RepID=A0AAD9UUD2_ACRCE|nr:HAUS augmin-like complex subunit 1 [Acropora cervicornis]